MSLGPKTFGLLGDLTAPDMPTAKTYAELTKLLKDHFSNKPSYHRSLCLFQQRRKHMNESLRELYANLKRLAKDCNFETTFDARLRDQLFMAVDNLSYFKFLLAENLKLETMTSIALLDRLETLEKAHMGEEEMHIKQEEMVNKVKHKAADKCKHCGYPHSSSACRFKDLDCRLCGRKGHLERICRSKTDGTRTRFWSKGKNFGDSPKTKAVKMIEDPSLKVGDDSYHEDDDVQASDVITNECGNVKSIKPDVYNFQLNNQIIPLEIDSGACVSLISEKVFNGLNVKIRQSRKKLSAYGGHQIEIKGEIIVDVKFGSKCVAHKFYVTNMTGSNLCGRDLMNRFCLLYTSPSPRDKRQSRMPSSA